MSRAIATLFGVGLLPVAPGTWGSAAAIPLAWTIHALGGFPALAAATLAVTLIGWWATAAATRGQKNHDPGEIVIDEVAGQWLALWPVSLGAAGAGAGFWQLWPGILAAFLLFRLFDMVKLGPVRWADRLETPLGVMLDDLVAGVLAGVCVGALGWLSHGVLGL